MKKFAAVLGLTGVIALSAVAQDPAAAPPAADMTVTTETTTTIPEGDMTIVGTQDVGTLPATGGAPIAMALAGALTAGSAFFLRRKLS